MTQDEAWKQNYDEVMLFITEHGRNLSKYNLEERRLYTWLKHQRKVMNAGGDERGTHDTIQETVRTKRAVQKEESI